MNSKSQSGQDIWVSQMFKGMTYGFFVDIGAGDGVTISNTYALEKELHWDGLCVEANTAYLQSLQKNRTCKIDSSLIGSHDDISTDFLVYEHPEYGFFSHEKRLGRHQVLKDFFKDDDRLNKFTVCKRKTKSLRQLLIDHNSPTMIHYLSLDTEGSEKDILSTIHDIKNISNSSIHILTITVEHNFNEDNRTLIKKHLELNGYILVNSLEIDDCYVHRIIEGLI